MKVLFKIVFILFVLFFESCSPDNDSSTEIIQPKNYKYLALGDSYTIGQSVCETCRFPLQLQDSLKKNIASNDTFQTQIIAQTGWTTSDLKTAILNQNIANNFDLVTLLIGVNNQYQNTPFNVYEQEFPELVVTAIQKAKGMKENVIVISIPDYAYTPFGVGNSSISNEIDTYNTFAENYCNANNILFLNITDITRLGLTQTELVASDGLHPSKIAYSKFAERILPKAKIILGL
jgi:acyl-CoA thioesterase-1